MIKLGGKWVRCRHRYKGYEGQYVPKCIKKRNGTWETWYQCQIKGCNHWNLKYVYKPSKKDKPES